MISEFFSKYREEHSFRHLKLSLRPAPLPEGREITMTTSNTLGGATDSIPAIAAKAGPSVSVSLASIAGYPVSDLILWATLIYTTLMIAHKVYQIWRDLSGKSKHDKPN